MDIKFLAPLAAASGKIFGRRAHVSMRMQRGKPRTYVYTVENKEWTAAQKTMRSDFGAASYFARVLIADAAIRDHFTELMRQQNRYTRIDNFVAHLVREKMKSDSEFAAICRDLHSKRSSADRAEKDNGLWKKHLRIASDSFHTYFS